MDNRLRIKIRFEMQQIDRLVDHVAPLLKTLTFREPDFIELTATGSVLHSFYNGVENIFTMIAKYYGVIITDSVTWHKDILKSMQSAHDNRKRIISETTGDRLLEYMMFRHFYRHAYGFQLDWNKMKHLINGMSGLWESLKTEINYFIEETE